MNAIPTTRPNPAAIRRYMRSVATEHLGCGEVIATTLAEDAAAAFDLANPTNGAIPEELFDLAAEVADAYEATL